jgi:hypothetical protein
LQHDLLAAGFLKITLVGSCCTLPVIAVVNRLERIGH